MYVLYLLITCTCIYTCTCAVGTFNQPGNKIITTVPIIRKIIIITVSTTFKTNEIKLGVFWPTLPAHAQSKSPLWAHLMAYAESEGKEEFQSRQAAAAASTESSPERAIRRQQYTASLSSLAMTTTSSGECLIQTVSAWKFSLELQAWYCRKYNNMLCLSNASW